MRNRFAPLSICLASGCCGVGGNTVPGHTSVQCGNGPVLEAVGIFELRLLVYGQRRTVWCCQGRKAKNLSFSSEASVHFSQDIPHFQKNNSSKFMFLE